MRVRGYEGGYEGWSASFWRNFIVSVDHSLPAIQYNIVPSNIKQTALHFILHYYF